MQIDSVKVHEALNQIALQCHDHDMTTTIECIQAVRKAVCDIEADTACRRAMDKYAVALEGLADK